MISTVDCTVICRYHPDMASNTRKRLVRGESVKSIAIHAKHGHAYLLARISNERDRRGDGNALKTCVNILEAALTRLEYDRERTGTLMAGAMRHPEEGQTQ